MNNNANNTTITTVAEKWMDEYEVYTSDESVLMQEVTEMEEASTWMPGVQSNNLRVIPIPSPLEAQDVADRLRLDFERTYENVSDGTKLVLTDEYHNWNISGIARSTLYETAKLNGSALGRMYQGCLAECLNHGLEVARGTSLLLLRHGKIMALHSDSAGGYCVMPISQLLRTARANLEERFGEVCFVEGVHSNSATTVLWELPEAQDELIDAYQKALENAVSNLHAINFMPVVRFSSSDTARSSAFLTPKFMKNDGTCFSLGGGVSVKHERGKSGTVFGQQLFDDESKKLFAKFSETTEIIKKMAETAISNPVNCFVGICNRLNRGNSVIPRKYADAAREEIENLAINCPIMSMHDIYLSMSECVCAAKKAGASNYVINSIEEAIAKVLTMDWTDYDIGGSVAWGDRREVA